jgi:hypothetical protein
MHASCRLPERLSVDWILVGYVLRKRDLVAKRTLLFGFYIINYEFPDRRQFDF